MPKKTASEAMPDGRHHVGNPGAIKSEWVGVFVGIRTDLPCDVKTSTWRSFAIISSGLYIFRGIVDPPTKTYGPPRLQVFSV